MSSLPEKNEKEILNELFSEQEKFPVETFENDPPINPEVKSLVEKIEQNVILISPVMDNFGQPLVSPASPQNPKIVLPISRNSYTLGLTKKISESIRWLAEWCFRLIKVFGERASFKEVETKL